MTLQIYHLLARLVRLSFASNSLSTHRGTQNKRSTTQGKEKMALGGGKVPHFRQ